MHRTLCRALSDGRFAILDDNRTDGAKSYVFHDPVAFCTAMSPSDVAPMLAEVERHVRAGRWAVGYFAYELGYALHARLTRRLPPRSDTPLFSVGIYPSRLEVDDRELDAALEAHTLGREARIVNCHLNMTKAEYLDRLAKVKRHIFDGDTYQVNYTLKYKFRHDGPLLSLFSRLRRRQRVAYGAYLDFPGLTVISRSPELFVEKRGESIHARPMKGTAKRGRTPDEDARNAELLARDPKMRAENVIIVDLLRNDLSRIGRRGTVETSDLFAVETYETIHQMVSTVSARVDADISIAHVLGELFPCGSITGAPKVRTMEIIDDLEIEPRGVYTGAIGYVAPDRSMCLNVAIRTLALRPDGTGEMGVGGGIIHDSDPEAEYEECRLKGRFLTDDAQDCRLIECVRWNGAAYDALDAHMDRLTASARALGFEVDRSRIESSLAGAAASLDAPAKVRLVVDRRGTHEIEHTPIAPPDRREKRIAVARERVDSASRLLQHKVSLRALYDATYDRYRRLGYYDVIFTNERGEVTEGTFHNVFIRRGRLWYTPPVSCGLLPGVMRRSILESREHGAVEKVLSIDDLRAADEIVLTNAVRGIVPVRLDAVAEDSPCCA